MKYCILFLLVACRSFYLQAQSFNQDPGNPNLDFSNNDFSNWQLSWGNRGQPYTNTGAMPAANSHTLIENYGNNWDGNTGVGTLKRVPDGLSRVVRLGAPAGGGYTNPKSYALRYNITVHAAYPILFFQLASVMDKTHFNELNTHYKFSIRNNSGNYLIPQPCGGITLTSRGTGSSVGNNVMTDPSIPFNNLPEVGSITYQPWQSVAIDLAAYIGQTITLEFEHNDCYTGHHGSYTYFSAAMRRRSDTLYFCRDASVTAVSPYLPGFSAYQWNTGAATDTLVINNPVDGTVYQCNVQSYNGCSTTLNYVLKETGTEAHFDFSPGTICNQLQFLDRSTTGIGAITSWHWDFGDPSSGPENTSEVSNPVHTFPTAGDYQVMLTAIDDHGCSTTITQTVSVSPEGTTAQISLPSPSCVNDKLAIRDVSINGVGRAWFIEGQLTMDTTSVLYRRFSQSGTYRIILVAIGENGCPDTTEQQLTVHDLPESSILVTPNTNAAPITAPFFKFRGFEQEATRYEWAFGYGNNSHEGEYTLFTYPSEIAEYRILLKTYNQYGCHDTSSVTVRVMPPEFMVPNAFSPNGDGVNDGFEIVNLTNQELREFSIFNRYGQRVFSLRDFRRIWDGTYQGKACDAGTYYYLIRYNLPGIMEDHVQKGEIALIR